jgi:RHS repeat-associated protein
MTNGPTDPMVRAPAEVAAADLTGGPQGISPPAISLPRGGGAIRGIGEKFSANPVTGTASFTIPIATSAGRSGFSPGLSLSYDSGAGNGPFGLGWTLSLPTITRKTDKGLPRYFDSEESDEFVFSGAEDLVPVLVESAGTWEREILPPRVWHGSSYRIRRYRPRVEGLFARIECWTNLADPQDVFWRSISKENITTWYGKSEQSRIADPNDRSKIFKWLVCESYDDRGNVVVYEYKSEDSLGLALSQANERNRTGETRSVNRYLKSLKYGNATPYFPVLDQVAPPTALPENWYFEVVLDYGEHDTDVPRPDDQGDWLCRNDPFSSYRSGFEIRTYRLCQRVLMFHHFPNEPQVGADCVVRSTDFTYSYEDDPANARNPVLTFLDSVMQVGYKRNGPGYLSKAMPAVEFEYSQAQIQGTVRTVDSESLENLPEGLSGSRYRWVDLDGEGLSGILTEQAGGWFYKRNLSPLTTTEEHGQEVVVAAFAPLERVASKPSLANITEGRQQLIDLAGDGQLDLVLLSGSTPGFYERAAEDEWEPFRIFASLPNLNWSNPNLKFVDLTGDGHADVMISEDDAFVWYSSLGESGFGPAERVRQAFDEEKGPHLVFADGRDAIFLSDMSGDGLNDLVRIRNGEICYWPNLGYGRFGPKVTMDNAPLLDTPDQFDQQRIRMADIDGSGVTDLIYLKRDGVHVYFNQSGNGWSSDQRLSAFPRVDDLSTVTAADLLGNGTACLVWSSGLPAEARQSLRYIDLMGGQKPHLLLRSINNLGAETIVTYAPSTKFYLADRLAGKPWVTRLPFPVHVVERVEIFDHISRNRFVTRYAYHHGYFDGIEREFRGFGMVEQWDTEELAALTESGELPLGDNIDAASHVPPVCTRTWFHTGVYFGCDHVSNYFAGLIDAHDRGEYYREPAWRDDDVEAARRLLDDTILPAGLTLDEAREACRALKGSMLRQEVYAEDGTAKAEHPYTVTEHSFAIKVLQPSGSNRHAVFLTHARESINYHYERNPEDPRTAHSLTLAVDDFGNPVRTIAVAYPRADVPERQAEQTETHVILTVNRVLNRDDQVDWRHIGLPVEICAYELVKPPGAALRLSWEELRDLTESLLPPDQTEASPASTIPYEQWDWRKLWNPLVEPGGVPNSRLRLIEQNRILYRPDDLGSSLNDSLALLPLGTVESLALTGESYKLALTAGLLTEVFERPRDLAPTAGLPPPENLLPQPAEFLAGGGPDRGGYVDLDGNGNWWIPAGRSFLSPESADSPATELAYARAHFFQPVRYRDPFHTGAVGTESFVTFDVYDLLVLETRDALGNRVTVGTRDEAGNLVAAANDYRVLRAALIMDPNRNRSSVVFDTYGLVVGTALMGKPAPAVTEGDSLDGFDPDPPEAVVLDHLENPFADPQSLLGSASTRLLYDLFAYQRTKNDPKPQPAVVCTMARETHASDPLPADGLKIQQSFEYSDGSGRVLQKKIEAEPGPVPKRDAGGAIVLGPDNLPEMTPGDFNPRSIGTGWTVFNNKGKPVRRYEPFFSDTHKFEFDVRIGVSAIMFYDPLERVVATLHPNHTWVKGLFDPWRSENWDTGDTILITDPKTDPDVGDFFRRLPDSGYLPSWFAQRNAGTLGSLEQAAANQAAVYAATPIVSQADSLGRNFSTTAHNRFKYSDSPPADPPLEEFYTARFGFDIEGNQREVIDARNRVAVRYDYDLLGRRLHQTSMEAGERWTLVDVAGKPFHIWDSRNQHFRTTYDALRRPADAFLQQGAAAELLVGRTVYGEAQPNPETNNLRAKVFELFDQAGIVTTDEYDFKGNVLRGERRLAGEYKAIVNWSVTVPLEADSYVSRTAYDALNRAIQLTDPDNSVIRPQYNEANRLERLEVNLRGDLVNGEPVWTTFVSDIDYDARGQRTLIDYGNGVRTTYVYDPFTFRVVSLVTTRDANAFPDDCPDPPQSGWPGCQAQNLLYTYDPAGNITHIQDEAQQTLYFRNQRVEPSADYIYDATYRLIEATGREHLGQVGAAPAPSSYNDKPRLGILLSASDGNAVGRYLERYRYDEVGNFQQLVHQGSDPVNPGWTRTFTYNEPSQLDPSQLNNRLTSTAIGATNETYSTGGNGYDAHGNMLRMPQLAELQWNFQERLQMTQRQAVNADDDEGNERQGERTWYVYNSGGERVRKITELSSGQLKEERVYLGGFEIYRRYGINALVRETLHIMDDKQRVALVETRTEGSEPGVPAQLIRYQFGNHVGSSCLELDDEARIISYEEYTPYGSTSFQAVRSQTETPKRYRFTGTERDEESGLEYHSARYFIPWLGRWASADASGIRDSVNLYLYVSANPVRLVDLNGADGWDVLSGGLKVVGGGFEALAGGGLITAGFATSETGVGVVVAGGGVLVAAHGLDTMFSGALSMWRGADVDTYTSEGLQALGMSRTAANLVDAGIGLVDTFGAGLIRAPAAASAAADVAQAARAVPAAAEAATAAARSAPEVASAAAEAAPKVAGAAEAASSAGAAAPGAAGLPLYPRPAAFYAKYLSAKAQIEIVNSATHALEGGADGITFADFSRFSFFGLKGPRITVAIQVLDNPVEATVEAVKAHELQHAADFLKYPRLSYWATMSKLPGRGIGEWLFETRGYMAEGCGVNSTLRAFDSMTEEAKVMFRSDVLTLATFASMTELAGRAGGAILTGGATALTGAGIVSTLGNYFLGSSPPSLQVLPPIQLNPPPAPSP